jgi:hypothetical protein
VNLICGAIFTCGLGAFAATQKNPWLVVVVAIPYLIDVVAMGYTRQSVAIGIVLAGLAAMIRGGRVLTFCLYVFVAALFHRTVICVLPLVALVSTKHRFLSIIFVSVMTYFLFNYFMADELSRFVTQYIQGQYNSQGAAARIAMLVVPAVLFLAAPTKFAFSERVKRIWLNFSFASLLALVVLFILPSSTVVDRLALYLIPLQLAVLPQVPYVYVHERLGALAIVAYSAAIEFVWFNFGFYSSWFEYHWYNPLAH